MSVLSSVEGLERRLGPPQDFLNGDPRIAEGRTLPVIPELIEVEVSDMDTHGSYRMQMETDGGRFVSAEVTDVEVKRGDNPSNFRKVERVWEDDDDFTEQVLGEDGEVIASMVSRRNKKLDRREVTLSNSDGREENYFIEDWVDEDTGNTLYLLTREPSIDAARGELVIRDRDGKLLSQSTEGLIEGEIFREDEGTPRERPNIKYEYDEETGLLVQIIEANMGAAIGGSMVPHDRVTVFKRDEDGKIESTTYFDNEHTLTGWEEVIESDAQGTPVYTSRQRYIPTSRTGRISARLSYDSPASDTVD